MRLSMQDLRAYKVADGALAVWWLGQAGFIVKSPGDVIAAIDPYFSNSCKAPGESMGLNMDRAARDR